MPPVAVSAAVLPAQIAEALPALMVGIALTVTVLVAVLLQPVVVPVTV